MKELTIEVEYCTFMVAILLTRYYEIYDANQLQLTPTMISDKLNSLIYGDLTDFHVNKIALHHGLAIHKRILSQMGLKCIEIKGTERALKTFFNCLGTRKGYEVMLPVLINDVIIPTKDALLKNVLRNRDTILRLCNYPPSSYLTVSSVSDILFVNSSSFSAYGNTHGSSSSSSTHLFSSSSYSNSSSSSSAYVGTVDNKYNKDIKPSFASPGSSILQQHGVKAFKPRKTMEKLSQRQIKNNAEKVLKFVEEMFGVEDSKLYLDAALDVIGQKRKLSGHIDDRVMCKYTVLEHPVAKNDMKAPIAPSPVKFIFNCPSGQKCPHHKRPIELTINTAPKVPVAVEAAQSSSSIYSQPSTTI